MALYGYKISGFPRTERYREAEKLLDKKLAGWEKENERFEKDGTMTLVYKNSNEDGTENTVTLVKNITESSVIVFSDIPLKCFRFGAAVFYLRDLLPLALFIFGWYFGYNKLVLLTGLAPGIAVIAGTFVGIIVNFITEKLLSKNRTRFRIKLIQMCWLFPLFNFLFYTLKLFSYAPWSYVFYLTVRSPIIPIFASMLLYSMLTKKK